MTGHLDHDALLALVPTDGATIGNGRLRELLGWSDERYALARDALITQGHARQRPACRNQISASSPRNSWPRFAG
jgi:hypothetical protein